MKVIDLHSDIVTDIAFRRERGEKNVFERVHLPQLKKAGVIGLICTLWVEPIFKGRDYKRFHTILTHALDDFHESTEVKLITTREEIHSAEQNNQFFVLLGLEGLTFMEDWRGDSPEEKVGHAVSDLTELHISHAIFAWNERNFIASGTGAVTTATTAESASLAASYTASHPPAPAARGLSRTGQVLIRKMEKQRWIIDLSHLDESSFWDVVKVSHTPLMASHSNARKLCDVERNLTDEQIKAIAQSGGIIGVNAYGSFVKKTNPTIDHVIDHIEYIASLAGIDHVGFGFDFVHYLEPYDLGKPFRDYTGGLEDPSKIPDLIDRMISRGFSWQDIEKVCYRNALSFLTNTNINFKHEQGDFA